MSAATTHHGPSTSTRNEASTCRKLVRPRLEAAGWDTPPRSYAEQTPFTDGRIIVPAGKPKRLKKKFSDFLLRYTRDITQAIVEAKSDKRPAGDGLQQAKDYPDMLGQKLTSLKPAIAGARNFLSPRGPSRYDRRSSRRQPSSVRLFSYPGES
jgi:type I site-specific restriction endonuclease